VFKQFTADVATSIPNEVVQSRLRNKESSKHLQVFAIAGHPVAGYCESREFGIDASPNRAD